MSDKLLIFKYLKTEFNNSHPAIYQYVMGGSRSSAASHIRLFQNSCQIFYPCMSESFIWDTCKEFLDEKKDEAKRGDFKPKPIY